VRLATSLGEPLFVCDRAGRLLWANRAAAELGVASAGRPVAASGGDAARLAVAVEHGAACLAEGHGHYRRVAIGAGPAAVTLRRTGDVVAVLVQPHAGTDASLEELLRLRHGCDPVEIRLALRLRGGLATAECAIAEGVAPGTIRWRVHRLAATLGQPSRAGLIHVLDRLAASAPGPRLPVPVPDAPGPEAGRSCAAALGALLARAEPALAALSDAGDLEWVTSGAHAFLRRGSRRARPHGPTAREAALARAVAACRPIDAAAAPRRVRVDGATTALVWRLRPRLVVARLVHPPLSWAVLSWRLRHDVGLTTREAHVAARLGLGQATAAVAAALGLAESTVRNLASRIGEWSGAGGRAGLADLVRRLQHSGAWSS
jgi:DNA-binding CsgD family transcriptional regulator